MSDENVTGFKPNAEDVQKVVQALDALLEGEAFREIRALDVLIAVCGYGDHLKASLGVTAIVLGEGENG